MTEVSSVSLALMWQVMADICHPALTVSKEACVAVGRKFL